MAPQEYEYSSDEIEAAFESADGCCECCGKTLSYGNSRKRRGRGAWEAHHGSRYDPVILCVGEPENCHLNCGHDGDFHIEGITPRVHKGGGYVR